MRAREDGADSLIEGGCVVREDGGDGVREAREDEGDGVAREHGLVRNDGAYNGRMVCVLICSKGQWIRRQHRQTFHQLQSRFVVLTILWLGIRMKIAEKDSGYGNTGRHSTSYSQGLLCLLYCGLVLE